MLVIVVSFLVSLVAGWYVVDRTVSVRMWRRHYREIAELDRTAEAAGLIRTPDTAAQVRKQQRRTGGWVPNPPFFWDDAW